MATESMVQVAPKETSSGGELRHWVLYRDFPYAMCGFKIMSPSWEERINPPGTDICTECQRLASEAFRNGSAWRSQ